MSYCSKCGSYIPESARKCPACGKFKTGAAESAQQAAQRSKPQSGFDDSSTGGTHSYHYGYTQGGQSQPMQDLHAQDETKCSEEDQDIADNKVLAALGYLGPMVILPLILKPDSPFVRFHANQSIALLLFSILCSIFRFVPFFGWMIGLFGGIFTLVNLFRGFGDAMNGKRNKLPIIGDIKILGNRGEQ